MRPHEGGADRAVTRPTPVLVPKAIREESPGRSYVTSGTPPRHTLRTNPRHRRWNRRPRMSASDVAVWLTWLLITAAVVLALCLLLVLLWPVTP